MNNNEILLLKLGEVVLKGLNRKAFEDKLMNNVRRRLRRCGHRHPPGGHDRADDEQRHYR